MTRPFIVQFTCHHCGKQSSAETGFGRWMRSRPELDSGDGIVRTDTDHTVLRYMTHEQGRDFQLLIDIEVKEFGANPNSSQYDIISFKHQLMHRGGKNRHNAPTHTTAILRSTMNGRKVRVRYLGSHLLQFEKTNPEDSAWIKWDRKDISVETLLGLLALDRDPYRPDRPMVKLLRDRHLQANFLDKVNLV